MEIRGGRITPSFACASIIISSLSKYAADRRLTAGPLFDGYDYYYYYCYVDVLHYIVLFSNPRGRCRLYYTQRCNDRGHQINVLFQRRATKINRHRSTSLLSPSPPNVAPSSLRVTHPFKPLTTHMHRTTCVYCYMTQQYEQYQLQYSTVGKDVTPKCLQFYSNYHTQNSRKTGSGGTNRLSDTECENKGRSTEAQEPGGHGRFVKIVVNNCT